MDQLFFSPSPSEPSSLSFRLFPGEKRKLKKKKKKGEKKRFSLHIFGSTPSLVLRVLLLLEEEISSSPSSSFSRSLCLSSLSLKQNREKNLSPSLFVPFFFSLLSFPRKDKRRQKERLLFVSPDVSEKNSFTNSLSFPRHSPMPRGKESSSLYRTLPPSRKIRSSSRERKEEEMGVVGWGGGDQGRWKEGERAEEREGGSVGTAGRKSSGSFFLLPLPLLAPLALLFHSAPSEFSVLSLPLGVVRVPPELLRIQAECGR